MTSLSLSEAIRKYEIPWLERDWPIDLAEVFGRSAPVVVEIGFGNGEFLEREAAAAPDVNFVGVERSWGSVQRLFKRLEAASLDNVRVVQGDGAFTLGRLFQSDSIDRVFVNFSDPWPKERHHGRRLIQPDFVEMLTQRLIPEQGEAVIATDHVGYAEWIGDVLEGQSRLGSSYPTTSVLALPGRRPTKYERRAIAAGTAIHYFVWRRGDETSTPGSTERVGPMPNVVLEGASNGARLADGIHLLDGFEPRTWQGARRGVATLVKLGEVYSASADSHLLVETMVREGELAQHIGILVVARPGDQLLIKLSPMGHPRPTWGVKKAVWLLAETVMSLHPETTLVSSTVGEDLTGRADEAK
jgi:tRNA (guanine-N7-)-methyltransferase